MVPSLTLRNVIEAAANPPETIELVFKGSSWGAEYNRLM